MIQFSAEEIERLRKRARLWPAAADRMKQGAAQLMEEPAVVPETGIGNWTLYYYCPSCSVQLEFDWHDGHHHRCPCCGQVLSGEPYDSAWWGIVNSKNSTGVFQMGLLYTMTGKEAYAQKAIAIMLEYSHYYKDYEVHGDIPYNGPGKSGAQTLDEANFLRSFAMAYDLLEGCMTKQQRESVRDNMLLPGAEFLMEHRHRQLHNHEVIINSAIAIIGLIFEVEEYVQAAVYGEYGMLDQLERGMLPNHMWFEGAFGYHFYALTSFFAYEKFALHTPHSQINHPNYKAMMELLVSHLEPGFRIPMLNDTNYGHTSASLYLYEFAYREIGGEKLLYILNKLYEQEERTNLEALIYGAEKLPECSVDFPNYHVAAGQYGNTILRGKDGRHLLFKHDSYGGEHDHYDRLGISYLAYGKRIAPDLGTTGYGAVMHYDYYKNTGSHNTVVIGEENQAPANGRLTRYEECDGMIYVEAEADWTAPYEMPDSFTIVQWNEACYRPVKMERKIAWAEDYFVDVVTVSGADPDCSIDWVMHFFGENTAAPAGAKIETFSEKKPYKYLHSMREIETNGLDETTIMTYQDGDVTTQVYGASWGQTLYYGKGPDNPSVSDINYQIERCFGGRVVYAHVVTSGVGECAVEAAVFEQVDGAVEVTVTEAGGVKRRIRL